MSRVLDLWAGMTGTVLPFAGSTAPDGWLLCHGQTVNRADYANLFAKIGTTFGAGDGSTTFKLPDLRGEFIRGADNGRGIDPSRELGSFQKSTAAPDYVGGGGGSAVTVTPVNQEAELVYTNPTYTREISTATSPTNGANYYGMRPRNVALNHIIKV